MNQFHLLKLKRYYPLFWTQFLGALNDNFLKNSLVILITFKSATVFGVPPSQMVVLAGGVFILPFFLLSATAGQIADRFEKSQLIRWIKLAEIGIMILAAFGLITEQFEFLVLVLFLMGVHSTFFGPIKYSILPQHLEVDEWVGGNALIEAGTFLAILLGTILGGIFISMHQGSLIVSAGLLSVAILGWFTSLAIPRAPAVDPSIKIQWNPITPTLEIFRFTRQNRTVFLCILGISWFWFFGAAMLSLFPSYCKDVLKTDPGVVTLFLALFSIGIGVGSLLCERLSRERLELGLVPMGSIGMSLFAADLFFAGGIRIFFDLLLMSIFSGFFIVPLYTLVQEESEPSHRSRIIAGNNILNAFFMVFSAIFLLLLMKLNFSVPAIFLILALGNAAIALYIYTLLPEFLMRFMIWILANIMYRLKITGAKHIPQSGPAVLVCNHVSFIDWMIIAAAVKRPVRFVMDHSYAKGKITRILLRQAKVILIAPFKENPELLRIAFEKAAQELQNGNILCIFPEGKLTSDGKIHSFKPGIEKIIQDSPVPVVPMALRGLWGSLFSREGGRAIFKRPKRFWSRVELILGDPVSPDQVSVELLHDRVKTLYLQ